MSDYKNIWADAIGKVQAQRRLIDPDFVLQPNSETARLMLLVILENRWIDTDPRDNDAEPFQSTSLERQQLGMIYKDLELSSQAGESTIPSQKHHDLMGEAIEALRAVFKERRKPAPQAVPVLGL